MRTFLLLMTLLTLSACAEPEPGEPHPFDKYMDRSSGMDLPQTDNAPPCAVYGCPH